MGDILEEMGRKTVSEFCATYGPGRAVFFVCDNTMESDVKGIPKQLRLKFLFAQCGIE